MVFRSFLNKKCKIHNTKWALEGTYASLGFISFTVNPSLLNTSKTLMNDLKLFKFNKTQWISQQLLVLYNFLLWWWWTLIQMFWKDFKTFRIDANSNIPNMNTCNCYHVLTFTNNDFHVTHNIKSKSSLQVTLPVT